MIIILLELGGKMRNYDDIFRNHKIILNYN